MIAIDTNVLVRLLLRDNAEQSAIAEALFEAEPLLIPDSVFMETEWVLRDGAGWSRARIAATFADVIRHRNVRTEQPELIEWALQRHAAGADLADMLHLVAARTASAFATFDRKLARLAGPNAPVEVRTLR